MTQPPSNQPPEATPRNSKRWPILLAVGFFGIVGVALFIFLSTLLRDDPISQESTDSAPIANPSPRDLREHQALVSEVVADLGREVLVGDSPTLGNPDAEIVLLEFSDFQCPYCSRASEQVATFMGTHEEDVLFVFKHLPLANIHPEALPAALAAWAAGQQNQFWPFHDALFANQANLGEELYLQTAEELGLDVDQFNRDRTSEGAKAAVARDLALAQELQLRSTPTFIMEDLLIPGAVPADFFAEALARLQADRQRVEP